MPRTMDFHLGMLTFVRPARRSQRPRSGPPTRKRNPRTGLKTGHYIRGRSRPGRLKSPRAERSGASRGKKEFEEFLFWGAFAAWLKSCPDERGRETPRPTPAIPSGTQAARLTKRGWGTKPKRAERSLALLGMTGGRMRNPRPR